MKIIEAAAYGKPIVATRIAVEGLDMHDGQELLIRDDAVSFADACLRLLNDYALSQMLGSSARETAVRHYDRSEVIEFIQKQIIQLANGGPASVAN